MNRREFAKSVALLSVGAQIRFATGAEKTTDPAGGFYEEPARKIPVRKFDVVVAGGGTAGVVAALAAARQGAKTALIEIKGYTGGTVVEGGTALHSFFNLWKAFPGVKKRQVVKGIPSELVDRLTKAGGCSGHAEMIAGYDYDSVNTSVDTEIYKLLSMEMLSEAGVFLALNTMVVGAAVDGSRVCGAIVESRSGRELFAAQAFIDTTAYGHLAAYAGAKYSEPNDYDVANSVGVAGVDLDKVVKYVEDNGGASNLALGLHDGVPGKIVRLDGPRAKGKPGLLITTVHDDYFMFVKVNVKMPVSPTNRDATAKAELQLRKQQRQWVEHARKNIPGCEKAFIARTSPTLNIRRGRLIVCDYDVTHEDVIEGQHFDDDVMVYGFHDMAPRLQVKNGGTYGIPYRAFLPTGLDNLLCAGMMITSDHRAHMSTRNTVSCMAQGQAVGTAAALCADGGCGTRRLAYSDLRKALEKGGVHFETSADNA
ncbi:MAG: FAD-dependent oxidoreductase [Phycisphaerae bacterium]|nr:FAD-dependent oxidoreductase [Phycisphaerae bacterium]